MGHLKIVKGQSCVFFLVVLASGPPGGLYEQCYWGIFADLLALVGFYEVFPAFQLFFIGFSSTF